MGHSSSLKLEIITRSFALFIGSVYAAGFLVVSIYLAEYGVIPTSLFRPRFVGAGVLFLVFVGLPAPAAIFARRSVERTAAHPPSPTDSKPTQVPFFPFLAFLYVYSIFPAIFLSGFRGDRVVFDWQLLIIAATYLAAIGGITYARMFGALNWRGDILSLLCATLLLVVLGDCASPGFQLTVIWVTWAGAVGESLVRNWHSISRFEAHGPEFVLAAILASAGFFAKAIYPKIGPEFGGGLPSPAIIQFDEAPPFGMPARSSVLLLEESEEGYFVLRGKGATKAVFLPRRVVGGIYFGGTPEKSGRSGK